MRRALVIVVAGLLLIFLSCCGGNSEIKTTQQNGENAEAIEKAISPFSSDFPEELRQYCIPWMKKAPDEAVADGNIHYYFMSSMGMLMDPAESDPYKWGDSTLIVFPNGQTMLIDVGMEAYAPVLGENLRRLGVERLDYLLVSHAHGDHIGGIIGEESFLDMVDVGILLYSGVDRGEKSALLYERCAERDIPIQILSQGDMIEFGAVRMEVLWPLQGTAGKVITATGAINNQSIVVRFDYKEHSSLFCGDLYAAGENEVIADLQTKLDVDLLKVPHHGYNTSSTGGFIYMVTPKLAVAMGAYTPVVQMRYEAYGVTYLYDLYEGYIHVRSDGNGMRYDTNKNMA